MVIDTSREAYAKISSLLGEKQAVVLGVLCDNEPMTNTEISVALKWSINRVTPRVNELRKMGLVELAGRRNCKITGMNACAWTLKGKGIRLLDN